MSSSDLLSLFNTLALVLTPLGTALLGYWHKQNTRRWQIVEKCMRKMSKRYRKLSERVSALEVAQFGAAHSKEFSSADER